MRIFWTLLVLVGLIALLALIGWSHAELRGVQAAPAPAVQPTAQPAEPGYISGDTARGMLRDLEQHDERMAALLAGVAVSGDVAQTANTWMFLLSGVLVAGGMIGTLLYLAARKK